ncbi:MAG: hypothetical protein V1836_01055 [Candidatus Aenigmatarchaeota archaeon]
MTSMKHAAAVLFVLLFILLPNANALPTAETVVADYCLKNKCIETALDAVASVFKGVEIAVEPKEINAYNCKDSDLLNITIKSPMLSTDSDVFVNGKHVCSLQGSLIPRTETCFFSVEGGNGGDDGYSNVIVNAVVKSNAGLLTPQKDYSKNFVVRMLHMPTEQEKTVIAALKASEISTVTAVSRITEYEDEGYNMSYARKYADDAEQKTYDAYKQLKDCELSSSLLSYREAKRLADFAYNKATRDRESQNNEKFNALTGRFLSSASNPITFFLVAMVALLGYCLYREKHKNKIKLEL